MSKSDLKLYDVILPLAVGDAFTYAYDGDDELKSGQRVMLPFGKGRKIITGTVLRKSEKLSVPGLREIEEVLGEEALLSDKNLDFWIWMSSYYMCTLGEVMNAALPSALNLSTESHLNLATIDEIDFSVFSENQKKVIQILEDGELSIQELGKRLDVKRPFLLLKDLIDNGIVSTKEKVKKEYKSKKSTWLKLNAEKVNDESIDEILNSLSRAPKQQKLLMDFIGLSEWEGEKESKSIQKKNLLQFSGTSTQILKQLVDKQIFSLEFRDEDRVTFDSRNDNIHELSGPQDRAYKEIIKGFDDGMVCLLNGVTSSGKTEIYARLIKETLNKGRSVLYMVPEISLTNQLITRLTDFFGEDLLVYHSRLNESERAEVFLKVSKNEKAHLIVGARSSIFLPFRDLGLIVVDEEHDRSFKQQDPAPRYQGRDSAIYLGQLFNSQVLLGTATPSMESVFNTQSKYRLVNLPERFGGFESPEIAAINMTEAYRKKKVVGSFSEDLLEEMRETLNRQEQIILFQNRRGYAPLLVCDQCAHSPLCENCDIHLTYHKAWGKLICHYCNYQVKFESLCSNCGSGSYRVRGAGTERLEEELGQFFDDVRIERFDLDSTRRKNAFSTILNKFENAEIDILIGTQMVTKGLDFDNVGLVGIINADSSLRFPDFRSFERSFQMLTQVSGRAGRKKKRGKVLIQTFDPGHPIIQFVLNNDFNSFVKSEMKERKMFKYPPFTRLIEVELKHSNRPKLYDAARKLAPTLKSMFGESMLGPEFPYVERKKNLYSMHFIFKFDRSITLRAVKKKLHSALVDFTSKDNFKSIKFHTNVDPY